MKKMPLTSITVPSSQPRNPLVAAARFRHAGSHRRSTQALRRQARGALRRDIEDLHPPHS